jgi:serine/threonine protein kinase
MPAPATVPEFLDLVRKSTLLPDGKLDEVLDRHRAAGTLPQSIDQVAGLLVREALLTFFQAKQLKLGRYKRFTIGSKYRLLELIGAGGMGAVYLCEHTLMRRLVALKVLPVEKLEDESNKERFYREARAVAALDHPNIVRAYDIDQYEKLHFLVMEYVDGTSLQEVVARYVMEKRAFDPVRAAHYIAQSAVGMQHGHELGMVHRDIKPGNLLLDRSGVIKILDMGLARFFNKQQDSVTEKYDDKCVLGTADYLAPEQAVSNLVDIRADIYALGGTLYFLLTGQTPFPDGTIAAKLVAHQTREPRPVESYRSDVPPGLLAVLRKMMAKNPAHRYQEPIEVAEALAEWADRPITPPPPKEMPVHSPLVQALAAPAPATGSGSPLARVLFGPGGGVFARSGGSSGRVGGTKTKPASTSRYPIPTGPGSDTGYAPDAGVVPVGPVSTARASVAPTTPLPGPTPNPADPRSSVPLPAGVPVTPGSGSATVVVMQPARRTGLYITIGILSALLFVVGAVAAYYIGRGGGLKEGSPPPPDAGRQAPAAGGDDTLTPGPADKILAPEQAAARIGEIHTVEFRVQYIGGDAHLYLNSTPDPRTQGNLALRLTGYFKSRPDAAGELERLRMSYTGKTVRARGRVLRHPEGGIYIPIRAFDQVITVADQ